jgi:pimeloyl-ACP methyl ester carboxylesterase
MATYVLVHGAWHTGAELEPTAAPIRAAGHDVHTPTIASNRPGDAKTVGLAEAIKSIVDYLTQKNLGDVVLVGHSYGGMVITGVADRAADRVGRVVYLDAANPEDGQSLADLAGDHINWTRQFGKVVDGVELVLWPETTDVGMWYGVTDPDDVAWMNGRLTPHPWKCFEQPLRLANEPAVRRIPFTNINASWSFKVRPPESARRASEGDRVWEIDTGHDLMITEPEAVAEMLLRVAAFAAAG